MFPGRERKIKQIRTEIMGSEYFDVLPSTDDLNEAFDDGDLRHLVDAPTSETSY